MKTQKIIAALLISSIATGLAGCSSQPDETSATTALEVTTAESTTEETTEETEAPLPTAADIDYLEGYTQFEVTSEDLVDGAWAQIVSYTEEGENMSPQLSWEPVEGATVYCVYMIDLSSWNWMHWKSNDIYETELPADAAFIVGNESHGIHEEILNQCDMVVYIPIPGPTRSLNVSHAASVALFEWYRQQINAKQ